MGLIENIKNCIDKSLIPCEPNFRAVLFGQSALYLENVKSIVGYSESEIILRVSDGGLKIFGKELYIKKYCEGDLIVCGKIKGLEKI